MLCPSVWEFKPKKSLFHEEKGEIIRLLNNPNNVFNKHYFIHLISVVLPDTPNIPECITNLVTDDCDYYKVKDFNLSDLINNDFIHSFIENGQLTALSIDTHLETDDCAAITSTGTLILSLNKESFQALGLEGKPYSRHKHRFCVTIDLKTESFTTEKKNMQRVQWCLKNNIKKFTMLFTWKPPEEKICPSSIAQYISSLGYEVTLCKPKQTARRDYNVAVPLISHFEKDNGDTTYEMAELTEWLGMYSLEADLEIGTPNNYLTTYECPTPNRVYGQVSFLKWTGFFSHHVVINLCNELRKYVGSRKNLPWISLYVQCFSDAPLNGERFMGNESNSYTIFLLPSGYYHMVTQASSFINNSSM